MNGGLQFEAGSSAEVGVQSQYLDSELYFVNYPLSARLPARPKFEIFESVVSTLAVNVMYCFLVGQRAAEMFRHHITMLENFRTVSKMQTNVSGRMQMSFGVDRTPRTSFPATFLAAKFLSFVVTGMPAIQRLHETSFFSFATQLALKSRSGFFVHIGQLPDSFAAVKGAI